MSVVSYLGGNRCHVVRPKLWVLCGPRGSPGNRLAARSARSRQMDQAQAQKFYRPFYDARHSRKRSLSYNPLSGAMHKPFLSSSQRLNQKSVASTTCFSPGRFSLSLGASLFLPGCVSPQCLEQWRTIHQNARADRSGRVVGTSVQVAAERWGCGERVCVCEGRRGGGGGWGGADNLRRCSLNDWLQGIALSIRLTLSAILVCWCICLFNFF